MLVTREAKPTVTFAQQMSPFEQSDWLSHVTGVVVQAIPVQQLPPLASHVRVLPETQHC
jgi:hypothetical protein